MAQTPTVTVSVDGLKDLIAQQAIENHELRKLAQHWRDESTEAQRSISALRGELKAPRSGPVPGARSISIDAEEQIIQLKIELERTKSLLERRKAQIEHEHDWRYEKELELKAVKKRVAELESESVAPQASSQAESEKERSRKAGIDEHLVQPVLIDDLQQAISRLEVGA
jgi:hypothetical protein